MTADVELGPSRRADQARHGLHPQVHDLPRRRTPSPSPSSAVFEDEADDGTITHVVYLPAKDGKPEKRTVKIGKSAGGKTEILDGLHAGDEVLTQQAVSAVGRGEAM